MAFNRPDGITQVQVREEIGASWSPVVVLRTWRNRALAKPAPQRGAEKESHCARCHHMPGAAWPLFSYVQFSWHRSPRPIPTVFFLCSAGHGIQGFAQDRHMFFPSPLHPDVHTLAPAPAVLLPQGHWCPFCTQRKYFASGSQPFVFTRVVAWPWGCQAAPTQFLFRFASPLGTWVRGQRS